MTILFKKEKYFSRKIPQCVCQKYLSWLTQWWARNKETKGNTVFLRKKYSIKRKMDSLWTPKNITPTDRSCYEAISLSVSQYFLSDLKMVSMQCRKLLKIKMIQSTQYCSMVELLIETVVYYYLLQYFHIWSYVPGSAKGR